MKKEETKASKHKTEAKKPTKEKIFDASVDLFSKKGFNDVSVREIANQAGIREGSIYNHYKNKEAILDAIIDYFKSELPQSDFTDEDANLMDQGPEIFFEGGVKMFMDRINLPQMEKIWRIICIETYRNDKIREFFKKELLEESLVGWETIFNILIEKKMIKPLNPRTLAYEYWSFTIFLFFEIFILKYDENIDSNINQAIEKLNNHTQFLLDAIKIED